MTHTCSTPDADPFSFYIPQINVVDMKSVLVDIHFAVRHKTWFLRFFEINCSHIMFYYILKIILTLSLYALVLSVHVSHNFNLKQKLCPSLPTLIACGNILFIHFLMRIIKHCSFKTVLLWVRRVGSSSSSSPLHRHHHGHHSNRRRLHHRFIIIIIIVLVPFLVY